MAETELTEVVQAEIIDELPAAERPPENTREVFLRPPDWRYQEALKYLEAEVADKTPPIPSDPYVQLAIRGLRAYKSPANRTYMQTLWVNLTDVFLLGINLQHSATTAELEAHIISGHSVRQLRSYGYFINPVVYTLYEKIFFDLSGICAIHSWVSDFLFSPLKYSEDLTRLRARLLAYYGSWEMGAKAAVVGLSSPDVGNMLKKLSTTERQKQMFDYMMRHMNLDEDTYATLMEAAYKSMTERDFQEHMKDREEAGTGSLEDLAKGLESGIRAYTQKELENNSTGLDFSNQYTLTILNTDKKES